MSDEIVHYYPDALAVFVPAFTEIPKDGVTSAVVAQTFRSKDIQEISSLRISLTVANSPGTFSMSLVNKDGRFSSKDNAEETIPLLYKNSARKPGKLDIAGLNLEFPGANYYPYQNVSEWADFSTASLTEDGGDPIVNCYTVQLRRDYAGNVVERWSFDYQGGLISIVPNGGGAAEVAFQALESGDTVTYPVSYGKGRQVSKRFTIKKVSNREFFSRLKTPEQGVKNTPFFNKSTPIISPMDRVVIYLSKRFDENGKLLQTPSPLLERAFTGVVNTVQDSYSNGAETIEIQGEDVTKYTRLSLIFPSATTQRDQSINPFLGLFDPSSEVADIFKGKSGPAIVRLLLFGTAGTEGDLSSKGTYLRGVAQYTLQASDRKTQDIVFDAESGMFAEKTTRRNKAEAIIDISGMLGTLFTQSTVHIIDPYNLGVKIGGYRPYEIAFRDNWFNYQAEFKVRRDVITAIAQDMHFVFYADRYGELWFRPPQFDNAYILAAPIPAYYILDDASLISFGTLEDDSKIFTGVQVSTEANYNQTIDTTMAQYTGGYRDDMLVARYGERLLITSNPLIRGSLGYSANRPVLSLFAKSILQRSNAELRSGQAQITLRVELDPGRPVYLPSRNMIYYAETIEHNIVWGQSATTTAHLVYGRKPWEVLPELLQFAGNDSTVPVTNRPQITMQQNAKFTLDTTRTDNQKFAVRDSTKTIKTIP